MRSPITKIAAAAVIIIALLLIINHFSGSIDVATAAFGKVAERVQNAKTISWTSSFKSEEGIEMPDMKVMIMEPYFARMEISDGRICILNQQEGKAIILDPTTKAAELTSTIDEPLEVYDTFKNFRQLDNFNVKQLGEGRIDNRSAEVFELISKEKNERTKVWVDRQTGLPFRMESSIKSTPEKPIEKPISIITINIVFDKEFDESLFSLDIPEGYELKKIDGPVEKAGKLAARTLSASNMQKILRACLMYVSDHSGEWPGSLDNLEDYGIKGDALINPRQPESKNGYFYIKPISNRSPADVVVLYEVYDKWGEGINAGFADGHVEFVEKEEKFQQMLE